MQFINPPCCDGGKGAAGIYTYSGARRQLVTMYVCHASTAGTPEGDQQFTVFVMEGTCGNFCGSLTAPAVEQDAWWEGNCTFRKTTLYYVRPYHCDLLVLYFYSLVTAIL